MTVHLMVELVKGNVFATCYLFASALQRGTLALGRCISGNAAKVVTQCLAYHFGTISQLTLPLHLSCLKHVGRQGYGYS